MITKKAKKNKIEKKKKKKKPALVLGDVPSTKKTCPVLPFVIKSRIFKRAKNSLK